MARFTPGQSGNPRGRKPGQQTRMDKLRAGLLDEVPEILTALVEAAKAGDPAACKLVLDRCLPPLKAVDLPAAISLGTDPTEAAKVILSALGTGRLTPDQAATMAGVVASLNRASVGVADEIVILNPRPNWEALLGRPADAP